jgi:hypothetical protein
MIADEARRAVVAELVHGTWARNAPWTRDGSCFREQLAKQIGAPVEFRRFCWSGVNSHTHRMEAARRLQEYLTRSVTIDHPNATHFVVAHSHGGNIACYALRDDTLRQAVRGVICLGTPFLHVQGSPLPRNLLTAAKIVLVVFTFWDLRVFQQTACSPSGSAATKQQVR